MLYLTQSLHRAVQQVPNTQATIFGNRIRTWSECRDRVARLAASLGDLGVAAGDRVAVLALNSDRYHEFLYAVPWADAVVVPLNIRWNATELAYSLDDCQARVLIVDDTFAGLVPELGDRAVTTLTAVFAGDGECPDGLIDLESLIGSHQPIDDSRRGGSSPAGIFYTGGTTGSPKGVVLSHSNLITCALGVCATGDAMKPGGRLLHAAPMFHLADIGAWIMQNVLGGTHVFVPGFTAAGVAETIERYRVSEVLLVPTMIQMLVDDPAAKSADLSSLRNLVYGASPIADAVLKRAMERLPGVGFTQAYGMTELSPVTTLLSPADHDSERLRRSAGRAVPHAEVRIVDPDGVEVPHGTVGEVVARGGHTMLGYWNQPEETALALRDGWMHTGDAGYMDDDGYVFIVDRIKDMIVSGGENVYSAEVENAIAQHPAVLACAVIGVPDPKWGERVHAVVALKPGHQVTTAELRDHAKSLIASYKAPRSAEFVDQFPLSAAGKILKRDLRAPYWPDSGRNVS